MSIGSQSKHHQTPVRVSQQRSSAAPNLVSRLAIAAAGNLLWCTISPKERPVGVLVLRPEPHLQIHTCLCLWCADWYLPGCPDKSIFIRWEMREAILAILAGIALYCTLASHMAESVWSNSPLTPPSTCRSSDHASRLGNACIELFRTWHQGHTK